jgi:hypothetical protein
VDERGEQRVQEAERREQDAKPIDEERAREVLPDDAATSTSDPEGMGELEQIVPEENHVR